MAQIALEVTFKPEYILGLCNWLAGVDAAILLDAPALPLLYDSGTIYRRELGEAFRDVLHVYRRGIEDCDSLAPARAGELMARGFRALRPGDAGYEHARRLRPEHIRAQCFLTTRDREEDPGPKLYHVEVAYWVGNTRYEDDPSARLGMYDGRIDRAVATRWQQAGIQPGQPLRVGFLPVEVSSWR